MWQVEDHQCLPTYYMFILNEQKRMVESFIKDFNVMIFVYVFVHIRNMHLNMFPHQSGTRYVL
jgi:hypothetical protein